MLAAILTLDYIWLGIITKNFTIQEFGSLITVTNGSIELNLVAGVLAWILIVIGCYVFAVRPSSDWKQAAKKGALVGLVIYGVYDLTNLAFINNYSLTFTIVDIAWGTILCSSISTLGFTINNKR
jgi:uncharacterized membrane protein